MKLRAQKGVFRGSGLLATLLVAALAHATPSDIDTTFGVGGIIALPVTSQSPPPAALQPDGKLLVGDSTSQSTMGATNPMKVSWLMRRYAVDGSTDFSFGVNGTTTVSFDVHFANGLLGSDYPTGIALQADGRFVVAGTSFGACGAGGGCERVAIVGRFNADGTLDSSFGSNGKVVVQVPSADSIAIQSDGRILVASNVSSLFGGLNPLLLRRLNVDGSMDGSFVPAINCLGNGTFRLNLDGKILVVATPPIYPNSDGFCITRLNADGSVDMAFGTQGTTVVGAGASAIVRDFFIDTAGRIVVAGLTTTAAIFRLTADGSLDTHFGSGGMLPIDAVNSIAAITGDCRNRTLVAGLRFDPVFNNTSALMARFLPDGSIDPAFTDAPDGFARTYLSGVDQLLVRPNGRILAKGLHFPDPMIPPQYQIIQYQGDLPCSTALAVEYYYAAWNYYFETAFPDEIGALDNGAFGGAWMRTGQTFNVWPQPNASAWPTCRFFSTSFAPKSSHFYTPFPAECAIVKTNPSWQFESIAFYIEIPTGYGTGNGFCPPGSQALYRLYNNGMGGAPNHRYTTDPGVLAAMLAQGWVFEGEANTKIFACVPQ